MALIRIIEPGDIDLVDTGTGTRQIVLVTGAKAVRLKIAARIKFFLGEWFLDRRQGLPYYRDVLVKNPNLDVVRTLFRSAITSVAEVKALTKFDVAYDARARTLAVDFDVTLVDDDVLIVRQPDEAFIYGLAA